MKSEISFLSYKRQLSDNVVNVQEDSKLKNLASLCLGNLERSQLAVKLVNVAPIFKKAKKEDLRNYRLVSAWVGPQGSILGPVLFNIFLNDLEKGLEGILSKFADNTKLREATDSLEGREALQRDLIKLEDWAITNPMKFNRGKCQIRHLGWGNPGCTYRLGNEMLENSAMERDLVDGKLNMSQQCPGSQEGQPCPVGHQTKHGQPAEGGDCPALLCTGAASP
ncbi:rna-directed dna polymerase from mobile element jockey-like [Pitangus sulphuratus]|nr:rna-directed dna polymerase from mobile element jockey-like [Pitangus sulphuratus]